MNTNRELTIYPSRGVDFDLDHMTKMALSEGFEAGNMLRITVHSYKEAQTAEELFHDFNEHIAPGKFECIMKGEYLESGDIDLRIGKDVRAPVHFHGVLKGRYSELKPYIESWNKKAKIPGNKLIYATPADQSVYDSFVYIFKEHKEKPGFIAAPYAKILKSKKRKDHFDFIGFLISLFKDFIVSLKVILKRVIMSLSVRHGNFQIANDNIPAKSFTVQFGIYYPNAPPYESCNVTFNKQLDIALTKELWARIGIRYIRG
tara:strand:+ start:6585 stop:7364 length:780 start_codon:yes stop_codon:yes gene_type:complete